MEYEPRTIALLSELIHPPQPPDPRPIQRLHNSLFESGPPTYAAFTVTPHGPVLSNPVTQPNAASQVAFLADRIQFREELGELTSEAFAERMLWITSEAVELREMPGFTGHQFVVRSLVSPRHWPDARSFLQEGMIGFGGELDLFERDPTLCGLRMDFAPTPDSPDAFQVRMESLHGDPRALFLEVKAMFPPIPGDDLEQLIVNVRATDAFLNEKLLPFVARFDVPRPS